MNSRLGLLGARYRSRGFTLVELLVAIAILSVMLLVLASITGQVQKLWTGTNSKIGEFRSARIAFDTMTDRLSQATLNTYIGYSDGTTGHNFYSTTGFTPTSFVRQSELRFLSGSSATTMSGAAVSGAGTRPMQSVFFLAPIGYTLGADSGNTALTQTLNICGYYLEFNTDSALPVFYTSASGYQPRYRFRLMELLEPAENNSIYPYTTGQTTGKPSNQWIIDAFGLNPVPVHVLAENVIAFIILPQLSTNQTSIATGQPFRSWSLSPNYLYDSSTIGAASSGGSDAGSLDSSNQLPPLVQITMVCIDEPSAIRVQAQFGTAAPNFGLSSLFSTAQNYQTDLDQLKANLQQGSFTDGGTTYNPTVTLPGKINFRVLTTTVSIKGAQWSTLQTN